MGNIKKTHKQFNKKKTFKKTKNANKETTYKKKREK